MGVLQADACFTPSINDSNKWGDGLTNHRKAVGYMVRSTNLIKFLEHLSETSLSFRGYGFANLDTRDDEGESVLHKAIFQGETEVVRELVNLGVQLNFKGDLGHTPLHVAAIFGHLDVVNILVRGGAEINATDEGNKTALHRAVLANELDIVKCLVEHGAQIDLRSDSGVTAIDLAAVASPIHEFLSNVARARLVDEV